MAATLDPATNPLLQAALGYAAAGLRVHPLRPKMKRPQLSHDWPTLATTDPYQIQDWWDLWPDANVGIVCGYGVTVLDFDVKKGEPGMATAERLLGAGWQDRYIHVRTPSGGAHVYLTDEHQWSNRKLRNHGLDIQAQGAAYVVAPPSVLDGSEAGSVAGPYLTVGAALPAVYPVAPDVAARVAELLAELGPEKVVGELSGLPDGWETEVELPPGLPLKVVTFLGQGDASPWNDDRSAALFGVAIALFGKRLTPAQVLSVMTHNEQCWHVATSGHRRTQGGDAGVQWLWQYCVHPAIPPDPFAALAGREAITDGGEGEQWSVDRLAPLEGGPSEEYLAALAAARGRLSPTNPSAIEPFLRDLLSANLDVAEFASVLDAVRGATEAKQKTLDKLVSKLTRERDDQRRQSKGPQGLSEQYVFVETQDRMWSLKDHAWVTRPAFVARYTEKGEGGQDVPFDAFADMTKVGMVTYLPQNPWSGEYVPEGSRLPVNEVTSQVELNMWSPPYGFQPMWGCDTGDGPNGVGPYLRLMRDKVQVPRAEEEHLLDWMAYTLQHPEVKINHMCLIGGDEGIGKDSLFRPMKAALGIYNHVEIEGKTVGSDFSPPIERAKVLTLSEMRLNDRHEAESVAETLKLYLASTGELLKVNPKYGKQMLIPNIVNVIGFTNHRNAVHLNEGARRYWLCWCEGVSGRATKEYFHDLYTWFNSRDPVGGMGLEKVAGWLLQRDVSGFDPYAPPPDSDWSRQAVDSSLSMVAQVLADFIYAAPVGPMSKDVVTAQDCADAIGWEVVNRRKGKPPTASAVGYAMRELKVPSRSTVPPRVNGVQPPRKTVYYIRNAQKWLEASGPELWEYLQTPEFML